jgi:biopolymer transport protein ExbD
MSKFKKKSNTKTEIPTSALPDIIFMLLFFFMVTTVMRQSEVKVEQRIPKATQLKKLEKKTGIGYIYIGKPRETSIYGSEPRVQVNDVIVPPEQIVQWAEMTRSEMPESEQDAFTVSLKIDREAKMGLVNDVQEELKEANALKIMYSAPQDKDRKEQD